MSSFTSRKHYRSVAGKVIVSFLLVAVTMFFLWRINRIGFREMLGTVNALSRPNPKLQLVNKVFKGVVYLDHLQRTQAVANSSDRYTPVLRASEHLNAMLDTLMALTDDKIQIRRIDSVRQILNERDKRFLQYLKLRADLLRNDTLTAQFRTLSESFSNKIRNDSLLTTAQKVTTIVVEPADSMEIKKETTSFWDKLWGRKKTAEAVQMKRFITEELNIKIDTLALAKEDSSLQKLGSLIEAAEERRLNQREIVIQKQRQLTRDNNVLITQLFAVLRDIESEEIQRAQTNLAMATKVVDTGLNRMNTLLIVFVAGASLLAFFFFVDITKSAKYRLQLVEAKEDAEHLSQVKQRFLANMSHELRTPLQAIVGIAEQMKHSDTADEGQADILYHSSQHLLQTVNEVLDYSKIVSGRFQLEHHTFDMLQLLAEVCSIMEVRAMEKGLDFIYAPSISGVTMFLGDPFRLRQILFNLLGNAIKFTEKGKITLSVSEQDRAKSAIFTFEIKDTGKGISPNDLDNIFTQFEQGESRHQQVHEGTGLGLTIVKELVQLHDGTVAVSSTPGKGSVFTVRLSYAKAKSRMESDNGAPDQTPVRPNGEIWVVDDDKYVLHVCKLIMEKHQLAHRLFPNAASLLAATATSEPAIILMDIRMPDMNGFTLLHRLKEQHTSARCIALTAHVLPEERNNLLEKGFDDFLLKPFQEGELLGKIRASVQQTCESLVYPNEKASDVALREVFMQAMNKDLMLLRESIAENNAYSAAEYLHRLAGRTGQHQLRTLASDFRKFELALRNNPDIGAIKVDIEHCVDTTEQVLSTC